MKHLPSAGLLEITYLLFMFTWDANSLKNAFQIVECVYPEITNSSRIRKNHTKKIIHCYCVEENLCC